MMRKKWCVVLGGAAVILGLTVLPTLADQGHGQMGHGGHDPEEQADHSGHYITHLLKHAKEFGLTAEQIAKLKTIQLDYKRTEARLEADRKIAKLELDALLDEEKTDLAEIQAKIEQLKRSEGALLFSAIKAQQSAKVLLTPDQREKDRAHRERMKSEGQGRRRGGMGGGMMGGMGGRGHGGMGGGVSGGGHGGRGGQSGGEHQSGMGGMGHENMGQGNHGGTGAGHQEGHGNDDHEGDVITGGATHEH
jgi:Spy/CpxP family protein refolding chaperone